MRTVIDDLVDEANISTRVGWGILSLDGAREVVFEARESRTDAERVLSAYYTSHGPDDVRTVAFVVEARTVYQVPGGRP